CEEARYPESIWDPDDTGKPSPSILRVEPEEGGLAGVSEITITGENFSPVPEENTVYFDGTSAELLSASETALVVRAPDVSGDSLTIKVAVAGAFLFAEFHPYKLEPAVIEYGEFGDFDNAFAIECDSDENVYVSLAGRKIVRVSPDGEKSEYAKTTFDKASSMKFGPDGAIYYVNLLQYVARVDPGGGSDAIFTTLPGGVYDLDFDSLGNLYAGGSGNAIYRIRLDGTSQTSAEYPSIDIRAVRVFGGYLYVGGKYTGEDTTEVQEGVWRNPIISENGDLGESELVLDWGAYVGKAGPRIASITFGADGDMYIGADGGDAITVLHKDGTLEPLYPAVLFPPTYAMSWGEGEYLYVNRRGTENRRILRVTMRKLGAPYYGRP
ncbi:MAG: IPT/TIG domain-containing protein, partial [Fidelibacterota bacterium]